MNKNIREQVYRRDKAICRVCGRKLNWDIYECGHIVDRVVGGSDELTNLAAMCLICNRLKPIHRTKEEFAEWCKLDTDEMLINPIRQGIKIAQRNLAENGYMAGGQPPMGYLAESRQDGIAWIPDPATFPLAQKAWAMRAKGFIYSEIHAACPGFYKQPRCWSGFFSNKTYLGVRKYGDVETLNAHPAACTQEQWDVVQAMRKRSRGGAYPRRVSSQYLLSGLLRCAVCGEFMSGSSGGGYRYYVCSRKAREGRHTCKTRSIGANKVDKAIVRAVLNLDNFDHDKVRELRMALHELVHHIVVSENWGKIYYHSLPKLPYIQIVNF